MRVTTPPKVRCIVTVPHVEVSEQNNSSMLQSVPPYKLLLVVLHQSLDGRRLSLCELATNGIAFWYSVDILHNMKMICLSIYFKLPFQQSALKILIVNDSFRTLLRNQ